MFKKVILFSVLFLIFLFSVVMFYVPEVSEDQGKVSYKLYLNAQEKQPLVIAFGGSEGGNAWTSDRWQKVRNEFLTHGYAFLAIEYFGGKNTPSDLDRISLNAIYDSIQNVIKNNPAIDSSRLALMGGSKGAELSLNLASRYKDFSAVVAIVPSHVSFPANTLLAASSSWTFNGKEISFVPMNWAASSKAIKGDLNGAFSTMLEDKKAEQMARIEVEKINGAILLVSATKDEMWPSTKMSERIIRKLSTAKFPHIYQHLEIEGSHTEPYKHFDKVIEFLNQNFKK